MLIEKLRWYSAFAGTFFIDPPSVDAQIVYTDIDPDTFLIVTTLDYTPNWYFADVDLDGQDDFAFKNVYMSEWGAMNAELRLFNSNEAAASPFGYFQYSFLLPLPSGQPIPGSLEFLDKANIAAFNGSGLWFGYEDHYACMKYHWNGDIYYGWIRLSVSQTADTLVIKDYAYNATPGQPILAGEGIATGTVNPTAEQQARVYPNPATEKIMVQLNEPATGKLSYDIINNLGISQQSDVMELSNQSKIEIPLRNPVPGMYLLRIYHDAWRMELKVFVSD